MGGVIILIICLFLNYCCVLVNNESLYRISCIRYLFLCVPAYMYLKKESFNRLLILLAVVISFSYLVFFQSYNLSPYILNYGWSSQQWPSYFWTMALFVILLKVASKIRPEYRFYNIICWLGRNSWYIFLTQMFFLCYFKIDSLQVSDYILINRLLYILITIIVSVIPAVLIDYYKNKRIRKNYAK